MKTLERIRRGLPILRAVKEKVNEIVDYLRATKLVQGPGILLKETSSGLIISVNGNGHPKDEDDPYAFVTAGPGVCISGTSETPAVSGGTNSTVPLAGATFSVLLEAGSNNVSITDGANGSKVISVTGSTVGGDFDVPPYNQLYASSGLSSDLYGRAMTFIIPVKAGTIGFWDEGGGAVGIYTNKAGTVRYALTNQQGYVAQSDGWMRISVYDDGSTPGECLRFFSPTGGVPLYKYGGASTTGGIGYPDYVALAGGTFSNSLGEITDEDYDGTTPSAPSMPQNPKIGITHIIPVPANAPIKYYSSGSCLVRFAPESGGSGHFYYDLSNEMEWTPNCKGWLRISILDDGSHASDCIRLYINGESWSDAVAMHKCGSFGNNGATGITSSISGSTVTISLSGGTGSVKLKPGSNISIDGSNGLYTISVTGITSGSGGSGFVPDWWYNGMTGNQGSTSNLWIGGATDEVTQTEDTNSSATFTPSEDAFIVPSGGGWLYAFARISNWENQSFSGSAHLMVNGAAFKVAEAEGSTSMVVGSGFAIPVLGGAKVWWRISKSGDTSIFKGCVFYAQNTSS